MRLGAALVVALLAVPALAQEPVKLHATGSLCGALSEVIANFKDAKVQTVYGPSGLLHDRIAKGEPAEGIFARVGDAWGIPLSLS